MPRAIRWTCSSLSITHGPAISTSGLPWPMELNSTGTRVLRLRPQFGVHPQIGCQAFLTEFLGRADEGFEQRVRLHGLGFELGVELAAQIPRVPRNLTDLHVGIVRSFASDPQAGGFQKVLVFAVELVAVAVPLINLARAISVMGKTVLGQAAGPTPQPHGAAQLVHSLQLRSEERRVGKE